MVCKKCGPFTKFECGFRLRFQTPLKFVYVYVLISVVFCLSLTHWERAVLYIEVKHKRRFLFGAS